MARSQKVRRLDQLPHVALDYIKRGWALTKIAPGSKAAISKAWTDPKHWITTEAQAGEVFTEQRPSFGDPYYYNVGLVHAGSHTLALDIDDLVLAEEWFKAAGLDLKELLDSTARIARGADADGPRKAKAIFFLPPGFDAPGYARVIRKDGDEPHTIFELRSGKGFQDVLPPSLHPNGTRYRWEGYDDPGVTEVPTELLELYDRVRDICKELGKEWRGSSKGVRAPADESEAKLSPRDRLVTQLVGDAVTMLRNSGLYEERNGRFRPSGKSSPHGTVILPSGHVFSHHAGDPLYTGSKQTPLSPFEIYARLYHESDQVLANRALLELRVADRTTAETPDNEDEEPEVEAVPHTAISDLPDNPLWLDFQPEPYADLTQWPEIVDVVKRGKHEFVVPTERNLDLIIKYHPQIAGVYRYDEFTQQIYAINAPYHDDGSIELFNPRIDPYALASWLQGFDEFKEIRGATPAIVASITRSAQRFKVDSLSGSLRLLPTWDGRPRLDTWLTEYCGAEDKPHIGAVGRKFLIGMVARAISPGCKVDTMPIFEGAQGIGKSTLGNVLAGELLLGNNKFPLCSAKHLDLRTDDEKSSEAIQRIWLQELSELSTMRASERDILNSFLTRQHDHYRTKYDVNATTKLRRCVWYGTTNDKVYLYDPTGARRFWPVLIDKVRIDALTADRDQLLAEALAAYEAGTKWWFLPEEADLLEGVALEQGQRQYEDPRFDKLVQQLPQYIAAIKLEDLHPIWERCLSDSDAYLLNSDLLQIAGLDQSRGTSTALGFFMSNTLGWNQIRVRVPGVRAYPRGWSPSAEWLRENGLDDKIRS